MKSISSYRLQRGGSTLGFLFLILIGFGAYNYIDNPGFRSQVNRIVGGILADLETRSPAPNGPVPFRPVDIVSPVFQSLSGKTYTEYESREYNRRVPCSQVDYDTDWAKKDPNLGKCRGEGGYGYGYKTEFQREKVPMTRSCPTPPDPGDPSWQIQQIGASEWIVSSPRGRWTVQRNNTEWRVKAHQAC